MLEDEQLGIVVILGDIVVRGIAVHLGSGQAQERVIGAITQSHIPGVLVHCGIVRIGAFDGDIQQTADTGYIGAAVALQEGPCRVGHDVIGIGGDCREIPDEVEPELPMAFTDGTQLVLDGIDGLSHFTEPCLLRCQHLRLGGALAVNVHLIGAGDDVHIVGHIGIVGAFDGALVIFADAVPVGVFRTGAAFLVRSLPDPVGFLQLADLTGKELRVLLVFLGLTQLVVEVGGADGLQHLVPPVIILDGVQLEEVRHGGTTGLALLEALLVQLHQLRTVADGGFGQAHLLGDLSNGGAHVQHQLEALCLLVDGQVRALDVLHHHGLELLLGRHVSDDTGQIRQTHQLRRSVSPVSDDDAVAALLCRYDGQVLQHALGLDGRGQLSQVAQLLPGVVRVRVQQKDRDVLDFIHSVLLLLNFCDLSVITLIFYQHYSGFQFGMLHKNSPRGCRGYFCFAVRILVLPCLCFARHFCSMPSQGRSRPSYPMPSLNYALLFVAMPLPITAMLIHALPLPCSSVRCDAFAKLRTAMPLQCKSSPCSAVARPRRALLSDAVALIRCRCHTMPLPCLVMPSLPCLRGALLLSAVLCRCQSVPVGALRCLRRSLRLFAKPWPRHSSPCQAIAVRRLGLLSFAVARLYGSEPCPSDAALGIALPLQVSP